MAVPPDIHAFQEGIAGCNNRSASTEKKRPMKIPKFSCGAWWPHASSVVASGAGVLAPNPPSPRSHLVSSVRDMQAPAASALPCLTEPLHAQLIYLTHSQ